MTTSENEQSNLWTVPNLLTAVRLAGAVALLIPALSGQPRFFAVLFIILALTDWVDGKLARYLHQRSDWGARLDSMADAILFGMLLIGWSVLKSEALIREWPWIAAFLLSYLLTMYAGYRKYGRLPAYHTWAAKTSWYCVLIAVASTLFDWSIWPFRIAMVCITLTNLEAFLITGTLPGWHSDVPSLWHARRIRDSEQYGGQVEQETT